MKRWMICAGILAVLSAASAQAGAPAGVRQVVVHYSDININQPDGARILLARLEHAASEACGSKPDIRDLTAMQYYGSCTTTAKSQAIAALPFDLMAKIDTRPQTVAER